MVLLRPMRETDWSIFGCGIADHNARSLRAFQKVGYRVEAKIEQAAGKKAQYKYDLVFTKEEFLLRS
jgi:L-amino acid N-acyltransferase YncA